jgi:hypothetical protein
VQRAGSDVYVTDSPLRKSLNYQSCALWHGQLRYRLQRRRGGSSLSLLLGIVEVLFVLQHRFISCDYVTVTPLE